MKSKMHFFLFYGLGMLFVFGDDYKLKVDPKFETWISSDDLLAGIPFDSNLKLQEGDYFKLSDGKGGQDYGMRTFALNDEEDWEVTFSKLKIARLDEVRVSTWNSDLRSQQDYDLSYSMDDGISFVALAEGVIASKSKVFNLTIVPCRIEGVTDLRFTFRNPEETQNPHNSLHSSILEIDALGVPMVPLTFAEAKEAGRRSSVLLQKALTIEDQEIPSMEFSPKPKLSEFANQVEQALRQTCLQCHGPDKQKGKFRIDTLNPDLLHGEDVAWWLEVQDVISNGEMPPDDADQPLADEDRARIVDWLASEIQTASQLNRSEAGHSSFRRMTRYEYNYALQDLLALPNDFARDLPPETSSEDGFKNSSEMLQMTAMQFQQYREIARRALHLATVRESEREPVYFGVSMEDLARKHWQEKEEKIEKIRRVHKDDPVELKKQLDQVMPKEDVVVKSVHFWNRRDDRRIRPQWQRDSWRGKFSIPPASVLPPVPEDFAVVANLPRRHWLTVDLWDVLPDTGAIRVRALVSRTQSKNKSPPTLSLLFGHQASNNSFASEKVNSDQEILSPSTEPGFYEWTFRLGEVVRNPFRKVEQLKGPNPAEFLRFQNTSSTKEMITLHYVEVTAPYHEEWPPVSHQKVFPAELKPYESLANARRIISKFMEKAWRRPVSPEELERKLSIFSMFENAEIGFQNAIIETLSMVLSSPNFLYLGQTARTKEENSPVRKNEFDLATRLSVFLWSSIPDEELMNLAEKGELDDPKTLVSQAKRMLEDPKAERLVIHFARQWLGMDLLDYLEVDKSAHPHFDSNLKEAMNEEPIAFFREVLRANRSVLDFLHSDYAVINERLAKHYGIADVYGKKMRKVSLDPGHKRGGLLPQAGLLAMNSDGKDSHPLKRGIWLLERLLNDPPPPPPPAVPEIDLADPEILKLSLKERMEDHRNDPACRSCHAKIDPWGIAFENFDATGAWRSKIGNDPVDASSLLYNKQELNGMDGLKRFLLENRQDQFARSLTHKMTAYALGRPLTFADRVQVNKIAGKLRTSGDGLADLVFRIVSSDLFRN